MGSRYRKTFKAGPIRVTASKSGISYSAGVKGARVTKRADGRVQTTLSAPGTGLSYTKSSGGTKKARPSSAKPSKATAPPKSRAVKPRVPTRSEIERAWLASGELLPAHGPRISERKAMFLAGFMASLAEPGEETRLFLAVSKLNPARDVLVLTTRRLLMFQADQLLRGGRIVSVNLSSVGEVTIRRRLWSASLVLKDAHGSDRMVCGSVSPKSLAWLRTATKGDPVFVLPG
ncbi:hypothetical protein ABIA35_005195 [Catenulispora sp. MAP12-49]|uniref:DUF4236 domain-containing protein n=1 Tax=Catenulispora sp. MAP12-49 TaxID=3156302 RepID=UPI003516C334